MCCPRVTAIIRVATFYQHDIVDQYKMSFFAVEF